MESLSALVPLLLAVVVFWLFLVRPARKNQRKIADLQSSLEPGQDVMTASGIFGTIVALGEADARLRVADGVEMRVHRQAIAQVVEPEEPAPEHLSGEDD
ncbi:MAG: preprotein translocase subunit YajC [Aeromicrobium sp.]|uniref:preprotein translocase subunit YajC n=1 Tax=Aeromicrobium sp. TaxID=1871063 RepID=UPI0039E399DE